MRSTKKRASSATSSLQLQLPTPKKRVVLSDLTNSPDVGSTRNSEDFAPNKPKCENNGAYPNCELDEPTKSETVISSTCMDHFNCTYSNSIHSHLRAQEVRVCELNCLWILATALNWCCASGSWFWVCSEKWVFNLLLFGFRILGLVQCFVFFILKLRIVFLLEFKFKFRQMLVHSIWKIELVLIFWVELGVLRFQHILSNWLLGYRFQIEN